MLTKIRYGSVLLALLVSLPPLAQEPTSGQTEEDAAVEEVLVTGTSLARAAHDTPLAATTFDDDKLATLTANSQADILNSVPTIKAEGGGGEVATNVFIKGLPSGGQYQFTPLEYDGMPVFSSFGLNSSAYDVYYRNDLGIDRLEFVRGGVSNLFGPGSVAGRINYISKTGSDRPERTVQLEVAEDNRARADFAMSGPFAGEGLYYAFSGFYRLDEGPIDTGNDTEGFQLRGNVKRDFADDSGSITFYAQYIDDQAQFYLPFPLSGASRERVPGNDGDTVYSVQTSQVHGMSYQMPNGTFTTSIGDGVTTKNGSLAVAFDKDVGNGWTVNGRARYADYDHVFDFFLDGDGFVNVPETQTAFLNNTVVNPMRGLPANSTGTFTYADTGEVLPANALLFPNRFIDRDRPATDMSAEVNVTKGATIGAYEHRFTVGGFYGNAEAKDFNITTAYLADFNNEARLVNLVLSNGTIVSDNGLFNAGAGYVNNDHEATRYAVYIADQMESDRFIFDVGARFEQIDGDISREIPLPAAVVTDATTPNLNQPLRDVIFGSGTFLTASVDTNEWAVATGALYKMTDDVNVYGNLTRGYFFPELRAVTFNALGQPQSYTGEIIEQAEVGLKFASGRFGGSLAALYTELTDRRQVLFVNDGMGGLTEQVNIISTESYGAEATFNFELVDNLVLDGNVTWQEHELTDNPNVLLIGNELQRQPNFLYNLGLFYNDRRFDASLFNTHTGSNFTSDANNVKLDSFDILRLNAGYTFGFGDSTARVGFDVYNLLDDDGITEGSPRQDANQAATGAFFVGRPVLPRRYSLRFTVDF